MKDGIRLFGSNELGQIELERKHTGALSIKGKFWAGKISYVNHVSPLKLELSYVESRLTNIHIQGSGQ